VKAAIVGRPNVGKSSLLNALLQEDRAIVTPIPGTTRDVLEEALNIGGMLVRVSDTAGIRPTDDLVEQEGIKRSRAALEEAQLILVMLDGSASLEEADHELLNACSVPGRIVVVNKIDLPRYIEKGELEAFQPVVWVSAKTGEGLDTLRNSISNALHQQHLESSEGALVTRLRHQTSLLKAADHLSKAMNSLKECLSGEFVAMDLRGAIDALGEITGSVTTEDILDRIFSEFCIGK
jgi:tRNA modification GTPase